MKVELKKYFIYFMMYAIIGWIYEVFLEVVVYKWGFSNRGVLFGPYCVVYGFGALIFIFTLNSIMKYKGSKIFNIFKPLIIFLLCALIATFIELTASYLLDFLTGSWPWQTYVDYNYNFQARIALSPSIRFGLGGLLFLYVIQPLFEKILFKVGRESLNVVFYIFGLTLIIDVMFTFFIL